MHMSINKEKTDKKEESVPLQGSKNVTPIDIHTKQSFTPLKDKSGKPLIAKALNEAKKSVFQIVLFHSALDSIVAFSLLCLACVLLGISYWYALGIAFVYAIVHTWGQLKKTDYSAIEEKAPELEEQLRTVADNWKKQNEIVQDLNAEVLKKMKNIRTGDFLSFGRITRELLVITIISFIIIGTSAFNVKFLDVKDIIQEIKNFNPAGEYDINEDLLEYEESQNLSEILGDESIAELGKQELDLELNPLKSDIDIGMIKPPDEKKFREVAPPQIKATSDQSYEDNIPKEYQKIVKTYFKEITTS